MSSALLWLPATAYVLLTLAFTRQAGLAALLGGLVKAHLVVSVFVVLCTEVLSAFGGLRFPAVLAAWALFVVLCCVLALRRKGLPRQLLERPPIAVFGIGGAIAFILAATFATAVLYPPNNWDSMTYHMSRVSQWMGHGSVSFYPTPITRQNCMMPLAEFAILHLQVLSGGDTYAGLVQWACFAVLIALGYVIAGELGLDRRRQRLSALLVATVPMAILQSSSTQNDVVVSSFLMAFALFMLRLRNDLSASNLAFAGLSLGLALLTKGTAYLYGAGLGVILAVPVLAARRTDGRQFLRGVVGLAAVALAALALNTGHLWRNYRMYGSPMSSEGLTCRDLSVGAVAGNVLRNGALHLGTPFAGLNAATERVLRRVLGRQASNPETTVEGTTFGIPFSLHEDTAGNLGHVLAALLGVAGLLAARGRGFPRTALAYALATAGAGLLFCGMVRWQPWASRLQTPLFVLAAPLLALVLTPDRPKGFRWLAQGAVLAVTLYSLPFAVANSTRSLLSMKWHSVDRARLYFVNRDELRRDYVLAVEAVRPAARGEVGLYLGYDDWEYPLWALAGNALTFRHVGVRTPRAANATDQPLPQYVLATRSLDSWEHAPLYARVLDMRHVAVYRLAGRPTAE